VGNFFGWMGMREQQRVLLSSRDHMNKVVEVAEHLRSVLQHFCAGELDEANVYQQRIFNAERQADELRRELLEKLSEGLFLPADRADLMLLVERADDVADCANGAARLIAVFREAPPEPLREGLIQFGDLLVQAAKKLNEALDKLASGDRRAALDLCAAVERAEEDADVLKASLYERLFAMDLPAGTLMLLRDLIDAMENTADRAEDAADLLRVLTVSRFSG